MKSALALAIGFCLSLSVSHLIADPVPLPGWSFTVTGNGSGTISSNGVDQLSFNVFGPFSGVSTYEDARATSGTDALTITSNTTYTLSASAKLSGPGYSYMYLLANGSAVATVNIPTTGTGVGMLPYSTSFTTGGPADPLVGQALKARVHVGAGVQGGGIATYTNITLSAFGPVPRIFLQRSSPSQIQISWATNYNGFALESAANVTDALWPGVTNAAIIQGPNYVVTLPTSSLRQYFRLRQP